MATTHTLKRIALTMALLACGVLGVAAQAQTVTWQRQAYGQGPFYIPGHQGDPLFAYYYPNNRNWSQAQQFFRDAQGNPLYQTAPSNWSTPDYPTGGGVSVVLGNGGVGADNAPTNLDRDGVRTGGLTGHIILDRLTILPTGGLNMEFNTNLTANFYDFQTGDAADATLTIGGAGGASPVLVVPAGGTLRKSAGTRTFTLAPGIELQSTSGTFAADAGTLALPGNRSSYTGTTTFQAAAGAVIELSPDGQQFGDTRTSYSGTLTGGGAGSVRLSPGGVIEATGAGATLNFPAGFFQWTGGVIGGYQSTVPITNAGFITLAGSALKQTNGIFNNAGVIIHTGAGSLSPDTPNNFRSFNNLAGGVYDLQSDAGLVGGGNFVNTGRFQKTAGAGEAPLTVAFDNQGTVAVSSGTLHFTGSLVQSQSNGTILTGGVWIVGAGATLLFGNGDVAFTTNNGDVTLNGPNANFVTFASGATTALANNGGAFRLDGGREIATTGALVNTGTLSVGAGSTLHVGGNLSNSGTATLAFAIGGPNASGPQSAGVIQVNGSATLAGNLVVTLPPGAAGIGANDTIVLLTSGSALSGAFANVADNGQLTTADGSATFFVHYGLSSSFDPSRVVLSKMAGGPAAHPPFFNSEVPLANGVYYLALPGNGGTPFGYYSYLADPRFIFHFDLGYEYWFDAQDGAGGIYFYDFKSQSFFFTSPGFSFPYLYDFSLNAVLYYYQGTKEPRYFFNFATGQIITK